MRNSHFFTRLYSSHLNTHVYQPGGIDMRKFAIVITLIGLLALPAGVLAQLSPISQFRSIETYYEVNDSSEFPIYGEYDYAEAFDLNLFHNDLNLVLTEAEAQASHYANQQSSIEPTRISVVSATYAFNEILEPQWSMYGGSGSYCEFEFTISESVDWTLTGFAETDGFTGGADLQIYDSNGSAVVELYYFEGDGGPFSESGSLEPGDYSIFVATYSDAEAWDAGINMESSASLNMVFEVSAGMSPAGDPLVAERYLRA